MSSTPSLIEQIETLFVKRGAAAYFGERVSMLEHGLQAAYFAECERAPPTLVLAALLHDVGHLLEDVPADIEDWIQDSRHEEVGSRWLAARLGPAISEPVRLHVPAKRYLCAVDAHYAACLSAASVHTLALQGGPMSPAEVASFEQQPFCREAVRVRRWDDQGKVAGLRTPGLAHYRPLIERAAAGET
jgi:phosphonate degradation associated HDIG domain protein